MSEGLRQKIEDGERLIRILMVALEEQGGIGVIWDGRRRMGGDGAEGT